MLLEFSLIFTITLVADLDVDDNYKIVKTSKTVTIDGNLSEWASIPTTAIFRNHKNRIAFSQ